MGISASANIIYGFVFECDGGLVDGNGESLDQELDEIYENDSEEWLARHQGLTEPEGDYDANEEAHQAYWKAKEELPLDLAYSGNDFSSTYLCVRKATINGYFNTEIPIDHFAKTAGIAKDGKICGWDELLKAFCKKAGIDFQQQPKWLLLASMG